MEEMYLVTADGWLGGYGSKLFCVGIFNNKEVAERVAKKYEYSTVTKLEPNKEYPLIKEDGWPVLKNDLCIGGYVE